MEGFGCVTGWWVFVVGEVGPRPVEVFQEFDPGPFESLVFGCSVPDGLVTDLCV